MRKRVSQSNKEVSKRLQARQKPRAVDTDLINRSPDATLQKTGDRPRSVVHECGLELQTSVLEYLSESGSRAVCPGCGGTISTDKNEGGIDNTMAKNKEAAAEKPAKTPKPAKLTIKLKKKMRVTHPKYGPGTVLDVPGYNDKYPKVAKVHFDNVPGVGEVTYRQISPATLTELTGEVAQPEAPATDGTAEAPAGQPEGETSEEITQSEPSGDGASNPAEQSEQVQAPEPVAAGVSFD